MKLINSIKTKIRLWNQYNNPYYYWWKTRKIFKRPKWHLYHIGKITWFYGLPICHDYYNCIIDFKLSALGWKSKYDSPRHEWNPHFAITLFRKWQLIFMLSYYDKSDKDSMTRNDATWEAMLDYLYFNVPLDKLIENHTWLGGIEKENRYKITIEKFLK